MTKDIVIEFASLTSLLKASSKDQIRDLLSLSFDRRHAQAWPDHGAIELWKTNLGLEIEEASELLTAVKSLVAVVLFQSGEILKDSPDRDEIARRLSAIFPPDDAFHKDLKVLNVALPIVLSSMRCLTSLIHNPANFRSCWSKLWLNSCLHGGAAPLRIYVVFRVSLTSLGV